MKKGQLFIISAPSGAGKTSLVKELIASTERLSVSVSHTTRRQRNGEEHGRDYYFVDEVQFNAMLKNQAFLEHARVFDNFYGTARETVNEQLDSGQDVILEIDWQGARQVRKLEPECQSIFILPPSTDILEQRLRKRGQDSEEVIARRMQDAVTEISHYEEFDYLLVNDCFEEALNQLKSIFVAGRLKKERQLDELNELIGNLL